MTEFDFDRVTQGYFSPDQCAKIRNTCIGIAGAGGLGSNCAVNLVRSGFVKFIIADFDRVETSNLNRQAYRYSQIGIPKVEALRENLLQINPRVRVTGIQERLNAENIGAVFKECDCIVEAFDAPENKAMITELLAWSGKFVVAASGVGGYGGCDRIVTKKVHDNFYIVGDTISAVDDRVKPYCPCVAAAAAKQADLVLQWTVSRKW